MASTYVNNLRLEEIGTGEQSGTWGDTTNTNLEIIGQAVAWGTRAIANASTDNITIADGALDADRCLGLKLTGGGQACTVTLLPNTSSKTWFMYNATAAALTFTCGSGANVIIPAGHTKVIATDGLGSGGVVHDLLTAVNLAGTTTVDDLIISDDLVVGDDASVGGILGVTGVLTTTAAAVFNGGFTSNADTNTFASANASDPQIRIQNTHNGATGGRLSFIKDKGAAAADGDDIGSIDFSGDNAAQEFTNYAQIIAEVSTAADTDEAGKLSFFVAESNGTSSQLTAGIVIEGEHGTDGEVDVTIGAATTSLTSIAGDMKLGHDGAELGFGNDYDVILTHVHNTGLLLNNTRQLQFYDGSQYIYASSATVLNINATDEIELNATVIDVNANLDVSGYTHSGYTKAKSENAQTGNEGDNYWKLGRLVINGPKTAKLNLFGKSGYGDGGTNEGETILLMRGSVSVDQMEGRFITNGAPGAGVKGMGYVPVSGVNFAFDIYGHLASYMSLEHEVITGGSWETSIADSGSTSAPTGYVAFTADNEVYLGVNRSHSYSTTAFVHNEDDTDMDFRVESDTKSHMLFVDGGTNRVNIGASDASNPNATCGIFATASNEPVLRLLQTTNGVNVIQRFQNANDGGSNRFGDIEFDPDERMINFRPIWNGVNYVQIRSNGGSASANLTVNPTNNAAYVHSINAFAPQLTAGNRNIMAIGQQGATGNAAIIGYKDSDTTANCKLIMSMWGAGDLFTMTNAGNVAISGSLSKGSGSFKIDHPLEAKKDTHHLVHSFIEGPQADNIYRGKVDLSSGSASVNIDTVAGMTDGTFAALNREVQCFTTNESGWTAIKGSVSGNVLTITAQENSCTDTISWMVIGERKDPHMMSEATTWTDSQGKIIIEPEKEEEDEASGWD